MKRYLKNSKQIVLKHTIQLQKCSNPRIRNNYIHFDKRITYSFEIPTNTIQSNEWFELIKEGINGNLHLYMFKINHLNYLLNKWYPNWTNDCTKIVFKFLPHFK